MNAARVLESAARMLGVGLAELSRLALTAPAGAGGLVMVPYLDGERTPNRPSASGSLHGLTNANTTPECIARAAIEGMLFGLADGLDALVAQGVTAQRVILIGGGAQSEAVRRIAPGIFSCPVSVPEPGEYVAVGAARQAAWVLSGQSEPPVWAGSATSTYEPEAIDLATRDRYAQARELILHRAR